MLATAAIERASASFEELATSNRRHLDVCIGAHASAFLLTPVSLGLYNSFSV